MLSQECTKDVIGRPEKLTGFQKNRLRQRHQKWIEREAQKLGVSHMTVRRALQNEKRRQQAGDAA